jgi:hypothetical protein
MPRILHGLFDERALRIRVYDVRIAPLGDYGRIWRATDLREVDPPMPQPGHDQHRQSDDDGCWHEPPGVQRGHQCRPPGRQLLQGAHGTPPSLSGSRR